MLLLNIFDYNGIFIDHSTRTNNQDLLAVHQLIQRVSEEEDARCKVCKGTKLKELCARFGIDVEKAFNVNVDSDSVESNLETMKSVAELVRPIVLGWRLRQMRERGEIQFVWQDRFVAINNNNNANRIAAVTKEMIVVQQQSKQW